VDMSLEWQPNKLIRRSGRILRPELLESANYTLADRNLRDIARINRWLGGHRALLRVLKDLVHPREPFSILDVGAGSGDMGKCLRRRFRNATVVSLDHRSFHLRNAAGPRVVADAFELPFLPNAFDFVLCSSVLHHFPDTKVIELFTELREFARRALIVVELERHQLAYRFLPMTKNLFAWSPLTVHDGPVSVAAGFRPRELAYLARAAGVQVAAVRRHWPWFRISIVVLGSRGQSHYCIQSESPPTVDSEIKVTSGDLRVFRHTAGQ
jgi:2-polyprenyl-3-methyl-5-hydroxy-6-metoxy-1,4-benzoquinol methylase